MSQVLALPKCFAIRSKHTGNYVQCVHGKFGELISGPEELTGSVSVVGGAGGLAGPVEVEGEGAYGTIVRSPHTRFFVEPSKEHHGLVHVRCCYNNKYWVPEGEHAGCWTIGAAHEPEEDISKASCTLFKPIITMGDDNNLSIRFLHSKLGKYAFMLSSSDESKQSAGAYLHLGLGGRQEETHEEQSLSTFTVLDLSRIIILPTRFALKGSHNNKYLSPKTINDHRYLDFSSSDITDPGVANSCDNRPGGLVIRNIQDNFYWSRNSDDWIMNVCLSESDYYFEVVKLKSYIALRSLGNKKICRSSTKKGKTDCLLRACSGTITKEAELYVEETVLYREIYNVVFNLPEARVHNKSPLTMCTAWCVNGTSQENKAKLTLEYTQTVSSTWDATVSMKTRVDTKIMAGIPSIANAEVIVSGEINGSYSWGKTYDKSTKRSLEYELIVPAMTKVKLSVCATQGTCDVPFSYKQMDILTTGEKVTYDLQDGMYYGANSYDVKYETEEEKIE